MHIGSVGLQAVTLEIVVKVRDHDLIENLLVNRGVFHRHETLDPRQKISRGIQSAEICRLSAVRASHAHHRSRRFARLQETARYSLTEIFSESPGTPGRKQQTPLITSSIFFTPAWRDRGRR